jgi:Secretory lipase
MIRSATLVCLALSTVVIVCECARNKGADGVGSAGATGTPLPGEFTSSSVSGALNAANTLPDVDPQLRAATSLAARMTYTSLSGINDGHPRVTGAVFAPNGIPPEGGWPIVAFGHPTTGIQSRCAPSLSPTLLGSSKTVLTFVNAGYVVTIPDYQGLGLDQTYHPYLDSTTVGYNLIDSVSATRKLVPKTSDKWVAFGIGQGGQAAWAANELVENHGLGLNLIGGVSVSPVADIDGLADAAAAGELTTDQKLALQAFLASLKKEYGDDFHLDEYRRGAVRDNWDALLACQASSSEERAKVANQIGPDDLRPSSPDAVESLRGFLHKTTLPQGPTSVPMLVTYGGHDPLIPRAWTDRALDRACKMGDVIQIQLQPDKGGADVDSSAALGWIQDRFSGNPARNDCESFTEAFDSTRSGG